MESSRTATRQAIAPIAGIRIQSAHHSFSYTSLVELLDLLDLVPTAHENARPVMNVLGLHLQHPLHLAVDRLTAG